MTQCDATINNSKGIHVRPSGIIFKAIMGYTGVITVTKGEVSTPIADIIAILTLGLAKDDCIKISVDGPDEDDMIERLKVLFEKSYEFEEM